MKAYHDQKGRRSRRGRRSDGVTLSKTEDQGATVVETQGKTRMLKGFAKFDAKYVRKTASTHILTVLPRLGGFTP